MKIIAVFLSLTPSFFHKMIRRLMGAKIGKGTRLKFGTVLLSKKIEIGKKVRIGPLTYISAKEIKIGDYTKIKPLSVVSARKIVLGKYVHVSPLSIISGDHTEHSHFLVGDHSRFFPYCWIETGEGVEIGSNVGIGGHTLIFTHGIWPDYFDGGPIAFGPVKIEDNVWLPWRVFVMPNVVIGKNAIIGANSTVNKSIPENVVAVGSPAKIINERAIDELSEKQKLERALYVLSEFSRELNFLSGSTTHIEGNSLQLAEGKIIIDSLELANQGDLILLVNKVISPSEVEELIAKKVSIIIHAEKRVILGSQNPIHKEFINFLRKYGVRLNIN